MTILILNWRDIKNPYAGGAEISLFEHAKYWNSLKNKVVWFTSEFPQSKQEESLEGVSIIRKGSHYTVHLWAFFFYITGRLPKADIIIDSFHFIPFFSVLYAKKKKRVIGLINEVAGNLWFLNISQPFSFIGYKMEPFIIRLYKKNIFITGSDSTKNSLSRLGIPEKNITIVHHGFYTKIMDKVKKEKFPTLLFLGRIEEDKGIIDALTAFVGVKKTIPTAQLWIVGKEAKKGIAQNLIDSFAKKVQKDIHYFGFLSEEEKFKLLKRTWVLIHPSYKEGWGLTVIEAASQGTPTVGYDVDGLRDSVQNGKTGILVKLKDTSALTEGIIHLIRDEAYYNRLSKNAQKRAVNFSWKKSTSKSWKIVKQVFEGGIK